MPLTKLAMRPGINREWTDYANEGGWYDCDKIRFRKGMPEKIGGWQVYQGLYDSTFLGYCRCIYASVSLDGDQHIVLGTTIKFYINEGGTFYDITPIRLTTNPMTTDPFDSTDTETTVVVTDANHGCGVGDYVTFSGATTFGGIPAGELNSEHVVTEVIDTSSYKIEVTTAATSTATGGGAAVIAKYQVNIGAQSDVYGTGWGAGPWGGGPWGGPAEVTVMGARLRIWFVDNFGEDLVFNVMDGGIYYWDATGGTSARGIPLDEIADASDIPAAARQILVSQEDRHIIALGAAPIGSATQDPLFIRWSSAEDAAQWTPAEDNTAGDFRLSQGSLIIGGLRTRQEILIWTDVSLHSMRFTGDPYTFGIQTLAEKVTLVGPKAMTAMGDIVCWMGQGEFYMYDGRVQIMPCTVKDFVFSDINEQQYYKIYAGTNQAFNEFWWFYPSADSEEPDRYVAYNIIEQAWTIGTMNRTSWLDKGVNDYPLATCWNNHNLYEQEFGTDNASVNPATAIEAYIEGSDFGISAGDNIMFCRRVIPDVSFRSSTANEPSLTFTLYPRYYPGSTRGTSESKSVTMVGTADENYTEILYMRMRSRQLALRLESTDLGVAWRMGIFRIDITPDGERE